MAIACVSWALHVAALALAPMSVVQVALAGGVVLIAVMAERLFGFKVGPRQWWGLMLTAAALIVLGITLPATHGAHSHFSDAAMISFEAAPVRCGRAADHGPADGRPARAPRRDARCRRGVLFGVSDTSIKALTGIVHAHGLLGLALSPWLAVAVLASIVAFYASARGLQDGEAVPVIAVTGTAANIAGIAGGILVFGDPLSASPLGIVAQSLAFVP